MTQDDNAKSAPTIGSLCPGIEQGIKALRAAREFLLERRDAFMCQHDYEQARVARSTADAIRVAIEVVEADVWEEQGPGDQRWVPVGERLPEDGKEVVVAWDDRGISMRHYAWRFVTHWLPLPGLPS